MFFRTTETEKAPVSVFLSALSNPNINAEMCIDGLSTRNRNVALALIASCAGAFRIRIMKR